MIDRLSDQCDDIGSAKVQPCWRPFCDNDAVTEIGWALLCGSHGNAFCDQTFSIAVGLTSLARTAHRLACKAKL